MRVNFTAIICRPLFLIALTLWVAPFSLAAQSSSEFLFLGDMPYTKSQTARLKEVIAPKIRDHGFPFVVHYGDFKKGSAACREEDFKRVYQEMTNLWVAWDSGSKPPPVFYTPGDNDWTDCDRPLKKGAEGKPQSELNRLDLLRRIFFWESSLDLNASWQYKRQKLYPENALWRSSQVQFGTVHVVGTNNGRLEILKDDIAMALAQIEARDQANRVWLKNIFRKARNFKDPANAVIITIQADVTAPDETASCTSSNAINCDAFAGFRAQLFKRAAAFKKPVLLVHGDTGAYCLDKSFGGPRALNLWRLNAGGDYHMPLDATVVTFNPDNLNAPFAAKGLVDGEMPKPC